MKPGFVKPKKPKPEPKKSDWFWNLLKIIAGVSATIAIVVFVKKCSEPTLTVKQKYDQETFVEGDLKPRKMSKNGAYAYAENEPVFLSQPIKDSVVYDSLDKKLYRIPIIKGIKIQNFDKQPVIVVAFCGIALPTFPRDYYQGIDVFYSVFPGCARSKLTLAVKDERVYISVEFKDLKKQETIGWIDYNHWKLYRQNLLDYADTDTSLLVYDKEHNIVLNMNYNDFGGTNAGLAISGYFINPSSILVIPNTKGASQITSPNEYCIQKSDSSWKQKAQNLIDSMKPKFEIFTRE